MSLKSLRVDPRVQRRINLARDQLLGMSDRQLSNITTDRLQQSFGLTVHEADDMLRVFCRS